MTTQSIYGVTRDKNKQKNATNIKLYNFKKGGADIVDQLNNYYTTRGTMEYC